MVRRLVIAGGALVVVATAAWPQTARRLTLAEARERARTHSPAVLAGREAVTAAAAGREEARAARLPQVWMAARYARLSDVPDPSVTIPAAGRFEIAESVLDQYELAAAVSAPVFTGFRLENSERAAGHLERASRHDLTAAESAEELTAERAYWNLHRARAAKRTIAESVRLVEAHLVDVRRRGEVGLTTDEDVLEVEVRLSETRLRLVQTELAAELAEAVLAKVVSLPLATRIALVDSLRGIPEEAPPLEAFQQLAAARRAELCAFRERIETAERQIAVAAGERLPRVLVRAEYGLANPNLRYFPQEAEWHDSWSVGIGLSWTAWDWGLVQERRRRAAAQARQLRERERDLRRGIALEVLQSRLAVVEAKRRIELARKAVAQAAERERNMRARFAAGTASSTQVLDAEVALERTRLELTQALADQQIAWAALERATGGGRR